MSRRSLPITTVEPGDAVTIHLRGRAIDAINAWGGEVLAVDGAAVRIRADWYHFWLAPWHPRGRRSSLGAGSTAST